MPQISHSGSSLGSRPRIAALALIGGMLVLAMGSVAAPLPKQATQDARARARDSSSRARDSVRAHRAARQALQMHHYRFRLYTDPPLPGAPPWTQPSDFTCEMSVYPYCFGPMNGDVPFGQPSRAFSVEFRTWDPMVPEFLRPTARRMVAALTRALDDAGSRAPGDRWIAGQRVLHRVEHGQLHSAQEVARKCRAGTSWCAALFGYASYLLDQHAKADSAFAVALNALGDQDRCTWEDLGDLLYGDRDRDWYVHLTCAERAAVNRTLWWLADPLYLTPGNERMTAHFYRDVFLRIFNDSNEELPQFIGSSFIDDTATRRTGSGRRVLTPGTLSPKLACTMHEREVWQQPSLRSLVRGLGVPSYFMLQRHEVDNICPRPRGFPPPPYHDPRILLQYQQPTFHFLPNLVAARAPLRATTNMWEVHDSNAVERYKPSFGWFALLPDYQVAYFRRGDSARIVAATDLRASRLSNDRSNQLATSALVLSRGPSDIRILRDSIPGTNVTFFSAAPAESTIVSLEHLVQGVGAARARFASGPPRMPGQRVTLSDLLLVDRAQNLPTTLDSAARLARSSTSLSSATPFGIFWEVYGLTAGDTMSVSVTATETARSAAVAIGRFVGVGDQRQSAVSWSENISSAGPIEPRSIALDLRALNPGGYVLRLMVAVRGQDTVRVTRQIQVTR